MFLTIPHERALILGCPCLVEECGDALPRKLTIFRAWTRECPAFWKAWMLRSCRQSDFKVIAHRGLLPLPAYNRYHSAGSVDKIYALVKTSSRRLMIWPKKRQDDHIRTLQHRVSCGHKERPDQPACAPPSLFCARASFRLRESSILRAISLSVLAGASARSARADLDARSAYPCSLRSARADLDP